MNRNRKVVPIEKARQLLDQRDELAERLEQLRAEYKSVRQERDRLAERAKLLEDKLDEAEEKIAMLESELEDAAGADEERERSKRLSAKVQELTSDLERVRRQSDDVSVSARREEKRRLLGGLSDLVESIDRGKSMHEGDETRQALEAMERQLVNFLRREGVRFVGETGETMDPAVHEAIDRVDSSEYDSGAIVDVQRRGLVVGEQDGDPEVVFPAKVTVAR